MPDEQTDLRARASELEREALRVYERYAVEVIEGFGFCPWASEARRKGEVQVAVALGPPAPTDTLALMEHLAVQPQLAIGLIVYPEARLDRTAFQHFAAEVRNADKVRHADHSPVWAVADFHPDAEPDLENAERLVAYVRRSPDPTLQLVRHQVLDRIRRGDDSGTRFLDLQTIDLTQLSIATEPEHEPLHARVAARNLRTVQSLGIDAIEDRIRDIHADRHATYEALGLPPAPWKRAGFGPTV